VTSSHRDKSLSDEATSAGAAKRVRPAEVSLGDERTFGGEAEGIDTLIDGLEIDDLEALYTIEGTLGQGGMGTAVLAIDGRLGRKVAIKRILGEAARSKAAIARFLTEARAIAAISHPNVVQIYELGVSKEGPFLVIEYIDGGSLLDRCKLTCPP
jgi:serine/threonine protein kinase